MGTRTNRACATINPETDLAAGKSSTNCRTSFLVCVVQWSVVILIICDGQVSISLHEARPPFCVASGTFPCASSTDSLLSWYVTAHPPAANAESTSSPFWYTDNQEESTVTYLHCSCAGAYPRSYEPRCSCCCWRCETDPRTLALGNSCR